MEKVIQDIAEIKGEMKYMSKTMGRLESVLEHFSGILDAQSTINKRILMVEKENKVFKGQIRNLEDWKLKMITVATIGATIASTAVGLILKQIFK